MPFRETLLNLAITVVLVLIVVLVGIMLKEHRSKAVRAVPVRVAKPASDGSGDPTKPVSDRFEILPRAELIDSRANEADTLRIRIKGEEHIFVLYFVDALETTTNHPQRVAEQGRYFGNATDKTITDTGVEAARHVAELLKTRPFNVITRWERVPNTTRYYALITLEMEPGKVVYLADLLMQKGWAWVQGVPTDEDFSTTLPADRRDVKTYVLELQALAKQAKASKAGIWAKVAP